MEDGCCKGLVLVPSGKDFERFEPEISFLLSKSVSEESSMTIPNHLKPFIQLHLNQWIEGAISALNLTEGVEYMVDTTDKSFRSTDSNPKVIFSLLLITNCQSQLILINFNKVSIVDLTVTKCECGHCCT